MVAEVDVPIPRACLAAGRFETSANRPAAITESDEETNHLSGACLPLPG